MAIFYECQRCTACCRWPGNVRVSDAEITALAKFKGLSEFDFIQKYTRLHTDKRGLSLIEKENHECIFLDGKDCTVQPVKPQQCKDFPNKWNFPGWRDICQAIPREIAE
jgi:Fe-S-cluster containining protein